MDKKTEGVEILVKDVLATIPEPYGQEIILEVFKEIQDNPELLGRYESLSIDVGNGWDTDVINNWIGKYVKDETGMKTIQENCPAWGCTLVTVYTKLGR